MYHAVAFLAISAGMGRLWKFFLLPADFGYAYNVDDIVLSGAY